jgi:hypothetical protein
MTDGERFVWLIQNLNEQMLHEILPKAADPDGLFTFEAIRNCIDERITRSTKERLLAAAPDLLALADDYLAFLVDTWHSMSQDDFEAHPTVVAVRAAIKKARGG